VDATLWIYVSWGRPKRFAIHKLIVATRREGQDRLKAEKDRRQARFWITALVEDRPDDLKEAYPDARSRRPKWRTSLGAGT
jgi:hypothetical protein